MALLQIVIPWAMVPWPSAGLCSRSKQRKHANRESGGPGREEGKDV
jgi:hypothetical protein